MMAIDIDTLDMSYLKEQASCPICSSERTIMLSPDIKTINEKSGQKVELRECVNCGHWWHNPMPTQQYLSSLYAKRSKFVLGDDFIQPMKGVAKINLNEYKKAPLVISCICCMPYLEIKKNKEFNYLEIGCGKGDLFEIFSRHAKLAYGVEPGDWFGDTRIVTDISKLPKDARFDVIVMYNVLEHLEDPISMMAQCRNIASKDARIYCCFPNKDSFPARNRKKRWDMIRPLGHLHYFSKKSVSILFNKSKWKIVKRCTFPPPAISLKNIIRLKIRALLSGVTNVNHQWYLIGVADEGKYR